MLTKYIVTFDSRLVSGTACLEFWLDLNCSRKTVIKLNNSGEREPYVPFLTATCFLLTCQNFKILIKRSQTPTESKIYHQTSFATLYKMSSMVKYYFYLLIHRNSNTKIKRILLNVETYYELSLYQVLSKTLLLVSTWSVHIQKMSAALTEQKKIV